MTEFSYPWAGQSVGDAGAYSHDQWARAWANLNHAASRQAEYAGRGPFIDSGDPPNYGLQVAPTSPASASIEVGIGTAIVDGTYYSNDAIRTLTVAANGSGNPRIDTIILRKTWSTQEVRLVVKQGTPSATPIPPAMTQTANTTWEIPICDIDVANGFSSIDASNLTPRHEWANAADGVYAKDIFNNSGAPLETGMVVIWDSTADRAVTTTTTFQNSSVAGVWVGRTADGEYGRMITKGVGLVYVQTSVTRGDILATGTVAGQATPAGAYGTYQVGRALEARIGAGYVLAYIDIMGAVPLFHATTQVNEASDVTISSSSFTDVTGVSVTLPLSSARDVEVLVTFTYSPSSTSSRVNWNLSMNGTDLIPDDGRGRSLHGSPGVSLTITLHFYIPRASITAGLTTFTLRARVNTGTVDIFRGAGTSNQLDVHPQITAKELP